MSQWKTVPHGGPTPGTLIAEIMADVPLSFHRRLQNVGGNKLRGIDEAGGNMDLTAFTDGSVPNPSMVDPICDPGDGNGAMLFALGNNIWNPDVYPSFNLSTEVAMSVWARNDLAPDGSTHDIVRKGQVYGFETLADGTIRAFLSIGVGAQFFAVGPVFAVGAIHHLGLDWDGITMSLYVDGEEVSSTPVGGVLTLQGVSYTLGSNSTSPKGWKGAIAEAALFDHSIEPERFAAHYNAGRLS